MDIPQLQQLNNGTRRSEKYIKYHYLEFYQYILNAYPKELVWTEKLYWYYHNINTHPTCSVCGNPVKFISFIKGYHKFCSLKCCNNDPQKKMQSKQTCLEKYGAENYSQSHEFQSRRDEFQNKFKQTCLEKYGVENPFQSESIKNKIKETNLEKYGVEHPMQLSETKNKSKQTCLERYGVEYIAQSQEIQNKIKQTCLEKYGGVAPACSKEIQNKYKQTCLKKYGVENPFQFQEAQNKYKQTCLERYGFDSPNKSQEIRNKTKQTCLKKYGVEYPIQSPEIKNKSKQTCLEKYGVEYVTQSQEVQEKTKQTCLGRYGTEHYSQSEEYKSSYDEIQNKSNQTCLNKYGVENPFQSREVQNKTKQTCLERYGVENYNQSEEGRARLSSILSSEEVQNKINNTKRLNHTFNSSEIEELFSNYLDSQHIEYKRQYRSKEYPFNCDFYLPKYDLYIEIQASWTHSGHPFNIETDRDTLKKWKSKNTDYYKNAIETWTKRDVKKREITKLNNLNYLEIFSNDIDEVIESFQKFINLNN